MSHRQQSETLIVDCDHCDGDGEIWEPCNCYQCEYGGEHSRYIECANCEGLGLVLGRGFWRLFTPRCPTCDGRLWLDTTPGACDGPPCPDCNSGTESLDENTGLPVGVPA